MNEPREISVRGSSGPIGVGIRPGDGLALEAGRQVEARVVGVLDNGTVAVRIGGNIVHLDGEALAAAARSLGASDMLPQPGAVLKLQCLENSPTPKFVLTGVVVSSAGGQAVSVPPTVVLPGESSVTSQLLQTGLDALVAQFPSTNTAEARAVISALIRFQVPVTSENFRVVLASVGQPGWGAEAGTAPAVSTQASSGRGMLLQQPVVGNAPTNSGAVAAKAFVGRAEAAAFLLAKGVVPSSALVGRIVGEANVTRGSAPQPVLSQPGSGMRHSSQVPAYDVGPLMTPEGLAEVVKTLTRQMRVQKGSMVMPAVSEAVVGTMLDSSGLLEALGAVIETIADLFRGAGRPDLAARTLESADLPPWGPNALLTPGVSQALTALLSLIDEYVAQSGVAGSETPAGAEQLRLPQSARSELAQKIALMVKDMPHGELMSLAGELANLERAEIVRGLGAPGTRIAAQADAAGRAITLKMLDLVSSSGAERVAHFEVQLPAAAGGSSQTAGTARIRVAWREGEGREQNEAEPKEVAILLHLSGLGKVVASLNFNGRTSVAVRFFVRNGEVRLLFARFQDQLRASLTRVGFDSNISISVRNPDEMPDPFAPSASSTERAPGAVDFTV
ncbi:MAG: flagellar hook-length control protein FliK [Planctomycetota bacterium]|nr:flagellar hook-length control protein FliK [Planctomycetota bacterium]